MVLKKSKFGSNTGNTLRRVGGCSSKGSPKCMKVAGYITKSYNDTDPYGYKRYDSVRQEDLWLTNRIQDHNHGNTVNSSSNVSFSLNKDEQWLLPERLKEEIGHEALSNELSSNKRKKHRKCVPAERPGVALIEKALRKNRHGEKYTLSIDPMKSQKSTSCMKGIHITYTVETPNQGNWSYHTESNAKRLNFKEKYHNTKKHGGNSNMHLMDDIYLCDYTYDEIDEEIDTNEHSTTTKVQNNFSLYFQKQFNSKISEAEQNQYDFCNDVIPDTISAPNTSILESSPRDKNIVAESYEVIKKLPFIDTNGLASNQQVDSCKRWVYPVNISKLDSAKLNQTIQCYINNDQIKEESLYTRFGRRYTEGKCCPRRIVIFDEDFIRSGTFICICVICEGAQHSKVDINVHGITEDIHMSLDIDEYGVLDFHLLSAICFSHCYTTGSSTINVLHISNSSCSSDEPSHSYVEKTFKPTTDVITMDDVWFDAIHQKEIDHHLDEPVDFTSICPLCFSTDDLTYIRPCCHFLCNICWVEYIKNKISFSPYAVICPEQGCEQFIDPITTLTYLDNTEAMLFIRKYTEFQIQRTPRLKWCPSETCRNIASYEFEKGHEFGRIPFVNCHRTWCFKCQKEDHWPSSCEAYDSYLFEKEDVLYTYDDNGKRKDNYILYKLCPSCCSPIEKDGGCNQMVCFCTAQFCWVCLKPLLNNDRLHYKKCTPVKEKKVHFTSLGYVPSKTNTRMIHKAAYFSKLFNDLENKQKPWIKVGVTKAERSENDGDLFCYISTCKRAYYLLIDCYKLLHNFCVQNAFTNSKHRSSRVTNFVYRLEHLLVVLSKSVACWDNYYYEIRQLDIGDVVRNMVAIETYLNELSVFGITKK